MKKLALVLIIAVALAFPALALAKKIKLSGGVVKDKDSRVTLTVVTKGKQPKAIKHMKLNSIDIRCGKKHYESFGKVTVTATIPVKKSGSFKERLPNVNDPSEKLRISGIVSDHGKRVSGNVKTNKLTVSNMKCDVPKQHFELSK